MMIGTKTAILLLTVSVIGTLSVGAAHAQSEARSSTPMAEDAALSAAYTDVAEYLVNRDIVLENRLANMKKQLPAILATDPRFQKMEKDYPGLPAMMASEMDGLVLKLLDAKLSAMAKTLEPDLRARLDADGIFEVLRFYRSDAAQAYLLTAEESNDYAKTVGKVTDNGTILPEDTEKNAYESAFKAFDRLNDEQREVLIIFYATPAGQVLAQIELLALQRSAAANATNIQSATEAEISAAAKRATDKYFAK